MHYSVLAERVRFFKESKVGAAIMCKAMEDMCYQAALERAKSVAYRILATGKFSLEDIADMTELSFLISHGTLTPQDATVIKRSTQWIYILSACLKLNWWDKKFKCTSDARWSYETGWFYFTSPKEYDAKMEELNRTRYERYMNSFVPLVDRWDYRMRNRSKSAEASDMLREIRENFCNKKDTKCIN